MRRVAVTLAAGAALASVALVSPASAAMALLQGASVTIRTDPIAYGGIVSYAMEADGMSRSYIRFDLGAVPLGSTVSAATLTLHQFNRYSDPVASIYRSDRDNWSDLGWRYWVDPPQPDQLVSSVVTFSRDVAPEVDWVLTPGAFAADVKDRILTLSLNVRPGSGALHFGYGGTLLLDYEPPTIAPVPEPAAWAAMVLGFGAVGIACRRSRLRGKKHSSRSPIGAL